MFPEKLVRFLLVTSATSLLTPTLHARCGVERWSIKTGTDSDAAQIDLNTPNPTSVANLIQFTAPHPIPKTSRIQGPETTLWTLTATLTAFKIEDDPNTGDSDYHLVLMDPSGSTMIAEIPSPDCVASGSAFTAGIASARQEFDARFTPAGQFQDVSVPVRVTGVGMFDFAHGQRGRSDNGIELHPVLDITFLDTGTPPPPPPPTPGPGTQLIGNPSFENGAVNPAPWTVSPSVIDNSTGEPAHTGKWKAWLCGFGRKHTDKLSQQITIPAGNTRAFLSFWLHIDTDETSTTKAFDTLDVQIIDSGGQATTLETFSNLDTSAYQKRTFDLADFIGQTVTITLIGKEDAARQTSFIVDDFALVVQ